MSETKNHEQAGNSGRTEGSAVKRLVMRDTDPETGFTPDEKKCHDGLMDAHRAFVSMDRQHPDEMRDFVDSLHRLQDLLAVRIVRRMYPAGWPTYSA